MTLDTQSKKHDPIRGGYPVYGIPLGIIILDTKFPRPPGDIGNAKTFPYPVHYEILEGIKSEDLIKHEVKAAVDALVEAGRRLQRKGVAGIITSCGLLIRYQKLLSENLSIPVVTSSLVLLPLLGLLFAPYRKIGIITADATVLNPEALAQAGWTQLERIHIKGVEDCSNFKKAILDPSPPYGLETGQLCEEIIDLCGSMLNDFPDIGVFLLECTNLAPYRKTISNTYSVPVFDIIHCAHLLTMGVDSGYGDLLVRYLSG